ncbi:hypothetical protein LINGRAPRIM_LOCUS3084 [Linum grandiflorum]
MCPMRFILVFFSAILAGYFAWRTVSNSPADDNSGDTTADKAATDVKKQESSMVKKIASFLLQMIQNGFWVFVDMASGRYLWRNIKEMQKQESS